MTSTERKCRSDAYAAMLKRMREKYPVVVIEGRNFFHPSEGTYFIISEFPDDYALVIEYASNKSEAVHNVLEDGDRFWLDELTSEDDLFAAMVSEIEG